MNRTQKNWKGLSGSDLKILALFSMAIDHFAASIIYYGLLLPDTPLFPDPPIWTWYQIYEAMRCFGRIAFPIFCFLLVEGFLHTSNRKKYALRLFLFALISELPFDLALFGQPFVPGHQNVFFTLLLGFLAIWAIDAAQKNLLFNAWLGWAAAVGCGVFAWILKTDYDFIGVLLICLFFILRYQPGLRTIVCCLTLLCAGAAEAPACLAFLPIHFYNGKRGISLKYFFYLFYPLHLLFYAGILYLLF